MGSNRPRRRVRCRICVEMFSQARVSDLLCARCVRDRDAEASPAWASVQARLETALAPFYGRPELRDVIAALYRAFAIDEMARAVGAVHSSTTCTAKGDVASHVEGAEGSEENPTACVRQRRMKNESYSRGVVKC